MIKTLSYAALAALAALSVALFSQYVLGAHPCELCVLQRYPYGVVMAAGIVAWRMVNHPAWQRGLLAICVVGFLTTGGIAAYHVAVEQHWVEAPDSCSSAPLSTDASLEELKQMIVNAPKVSCADVGASLAGISMATWNMLYAFGCASVIIAVWRKRWRKT